MAGNGIDTVRDIRCIHAITPGVICRIIGTGHAPVNNADRNNCLHNMAVVISLNVSMVEGGYADSHRCVHDPHVEPLQGRVVVAGDPVLPQDYRRWNDTGNGLMLTFWKRRRRQFIGWALLFGSNCECVKIGQRWEWMVMENFRCYKDCRLSDFEKNTRNHSIVLAIAPGNRNRLMHFLQVRGDESNGPALVMRQYDMRRSIDRTIGSQMQLRTRLHDYSDRSSESKFAQEILKRWVGAVASISYVGVPRKRNDV